MPDVPLKAVALAFVAVVSVAAAPPESVATSVLALASTSAPTSAGARCAVTLPNRTVPPGAGFGAAGFNYGNLRLRAHLYWPGGTLSAGTLPDGGSMAAINRDGSVSVKVGWWIRDLSNLVIRGRRLDVPAAPLRASVPSGYGPAYRLGSSLGFQPTVLTFPTMGCWRVAGHAGSATLTFVVKVIRLKSTTR